MTGLMVPKVNSHAPFPFTDVCGEVTQKLNFNFHDYIEQHVMIANIVLVCMG